MSATPPAATNPDVGATGEADPEAAPDVTVVSPVYGCRAALRDLAERVRAGFEGTGLTWELVLVDDRAPDTPWPLIEELARADARVRGVRLTRNHGQHLAIWAGLEAARGAHIAVVDCDLQDDPALIPTLLAELRAQSVDAMVVDRGAWSDSTLRRLGSRSFYRVIRLLTGVEIGNVGNFGLYSRRLVDILVQFREQEVFLPVMVSLTGLPRGHYRIDRDARHSGKSAYSVGRLMRLAVAIIIRFSDRPLQISIVLGLAMSGISLVISGMLFVLWLMGTFTVQGWTSTILSLWFLSGMILATLGVHGFYLGRVFREVQGRPRILVETTTDTVRDTATASAPG